MKARVIVLIAVVLAFFHFSTLMILGPEYDESLYVNTALGCPNKGIFDTFVKEKFGTCLPVMVSVYLGALPSYLYKAAFSLFGTNVLVLRLLSFSLYFVLLGITYLLVKRVFDKETASWSVFLLLFDFSFTLDAFYKSVVVIPTLLRVGSLLACTVALEQKKWRLIWILAAGVLTGLAIWTKLDSLFFYLPLGVAALIAYRTSLRSHAERVALFFVGGLLIGILPLLYFVLKFHTVVLAAIHTVSQTSHVSLLGKLYTLFPLVAYQQFPLILSLQPRTGWVLAGGGLFVLQIAILVRYLRHRDRREKALASAIVLFEILFLFIPSLEKSHHALLLVPLLHILLARFMSHRRQTHQLLLAIGIVLLFAFQENTFLHSATITCGYRNFACGIYQLQDETKRMSEVVVYDWGIATQLELLTKGVVTIHEIAYDTGSMLEQHIQKYMDRCLPFIAQSPAFFTSTVALTEVQLYGNPKYQRSVIDAQGNQYVVWSCTTTPPTLPSR